MKLKSNETRTLLMTHDYIRTLGLQGYEENMQFDAQECLSYIIDLFYPWLIDESNNSNYGIPDDCLFLLDGEETIHCHKCNRYANKYFREAMGRITFPHPDIEYSIQCEINEMINDSHGEQMDKRYECEHCNPIKTDATRQRTLINAEKYFIIQLKIFGYNGITDAFKIIPNLIIEEEINNILLGKLRLCAVVYHIGNSPYHGHYVCAVKDGQSWYTCNDDKIDLGVKLRCNPSINNDMLIPYLLIYEKVIELEVPIQLEIPNVIHSGESTLTTCQNKSANNNLDINDRDVCTMKNKDIRFDNPGNANDHHKKDPQNASEMMKKNLLMELAAQNKRISDLDYKRKERDTLLMEIDIKNKEIVSAKRAKKSLKAIFATKIHVDDPLFTEKLNKCNEEVLFYNQSIADAQNEIKLRSDALKEIEKGNTTKKSVYVRQEGNKVVNYNFGKRKSKFASKDALFKKKLRLTNEGKEKQHEIDKLSKKRIRETPEGRKKIKNR